MEILAFLAGPCLGILGFVLFIFYMKKQFELEKEFKDQLRKELELKNKGK